MLNDMIVQGKVAGGGDMQAMQLSLYPPLHLMSHTLSFHAQLQALSCASHV